jgi:hypothetical protein
MRRAVAAALVAACLLLLTWPALADRKPSARSRVVDLPVTGAAAILTSSLTPQASASELLVTIAVRDTNSVANVIVSTSAGTTFTLALNDGTALTAGRIYTFGVGCDSNDTYNFTLSTTTHLARLYVHERRYSDP